jgi:hypothetical protein
MHYFWQKGLGSHFGLFLHKLIWSPSLHCIPIAQNFCYIFKRRKIWKYVCTYVVYCFAQPKIVLVNPPPSNSEMNANIYIREERFYNYTVCARNLTFLQTLQFSNFQASLNHRANVCSCFFKTRIFCVVVSVDLVFANRYLCNLLSRS